MDLLNFVYKVLGFEYEVSLSTRPEEFIGEVELWEQAEFQLEQAIKSRGIPYTIQEGQGAFYGPKIDVHLKDSFGKMHQCGTT